MIQEFECIWIKRKTWWAFKVRKGWQHLSFWVVASFSRPESSRFFSVGYLKERVYQDKVKPRNLADLKNKIRKEWPLNLKFSRRWWPTSAWDWRNAWTWIGGTWSTFSKPQKTLFDFVEIYLYIIYIWPIYSDPCRSHVFQENSNWS